MKRHCLRTLLIALLTLVVGGLVYYRTDIEIVVGLDNLFRGRGVRQPPQEVVIVALDEKSEEALGESFGDYPKWRKYHAKVVDELHRQGAALIVFDLNFIQAQADVDPAFAAALAKAGNVLLTECVIQIFWSKTDYWNWTITKSAGRKECSKVNGKLPGKPITPTNRNEEKAYTIELYKHTPIETLAKAALDHAPFYLPEDEDAVTPKIHESWAFLAQLDSTPALPVLAWAYYLQRPAKLAGESSPEKLSRELARQRQLCFNSHEIQPEQTYSNPNLLSSQLMNFLCFGEDSLYLDYYGPPKTLKTFSYSDVYAGKAGGFKDKVVFIGLASSQVAVGQKVDVFRTPFTSNATGKMFGVEIMATQFANLLEGRQITSPVPPLLFLLTFGVLTGFLLCLFPGITGLLVTLLVSACYLSLALWLFSRNAFWLPVAVPLLIQLPIAWLLTLFWSYRDLQAEIQRILDFVRRVFPDWLPVISGIHGKLKLDLSKPDYSFERDVTGLCLATDIEDYTKVAAHSTPHQLLALLKEYYKVLAQPVKDRRGHIADVAGDAMIAFWIFDTNSAVNELRLSASRAALDMQAAVSNFNTAHENNRLPTRIGIHEGEMALGELNAAGSVQYRAIGDTVNAASRIQGVNKFLGTQILASAAIAHDLEDIVYRSVGRFLLVGLSEPIELIEIFSNEKYQAIAKTDLLTRFADGLSKFQQQLWQEAIEQFQFILDNLGKDGPAQFYLNLALVYRKNPPPEGGAYVQFTSK